MDGLRAGFTEFLQSAGRIGSVIAAIAQDRLELASLELREQKLHLMELLIMAGLTICFFFLTLIALTATIVFILPPERRLTGLIIITALYAIGGLLSIMGVSRKLRRAADPFAQSIQEIKKDMKCF